MLTRKEYKEKKLQAYERKLDKMYNKEAKKEYKKYSEEDYMSPDFIDLNYKVCDMIEEIDILDLETSYLNSLHTTIIMQDKQNYALIKNFKMYKDIKDHMHDYQKFEQYVQWFKARREEAIKQYEEYKSNQKYVYYNKLNINPKMIDLLQYSEEKLEPLEKYLLNLKLKKVLQNKQQNKFKNKL